MPAQDLTFQTKDEAAWWLEQEQYAIAAAEQQGASPEEIDRRYEIASDVAFANNVASPIVGEYVDRLVSVGLDDISQEMDARYKTLCEVNGVEPEYPELSDKIQRAAQMTRWLDLGLQPDDLHDNPIMAYTS